MDRQIPIRVLNQQTSAVLSEVAEGHAITITNDGRPVARIVPLATEMAALDRLVEQGLAIGPTVTGPIVIPPPTLHSDVDVAAAMARDRKEERW
ncbi:MAG TPA: type II toxin-antitoxin system prevent-host-death family antitoxin [Chloroflexota bacterium]|jgi:prevent-host-death family protein